MKPVRDPDRTRRQSSAPLALRLARFSLRYADDPARALAAVRFALTDAPEHPDAADLLFDVLSHPGAPLATRRAAALLLLSHCDRTGRLEEALRVLDAAIPLHEGERRWALRWDLANRLTVLGRQPEALRQLGALLLEAPRDAAGRAHLWQVASQMGLAGLREVLSASGGAPPVHPSAADQLTRMAELLRVDFGAGADALPHYVEALELEPHHPGARAGLQALLSWPSEAGRAAEALARAYRIAGERERLVELLPLRLAAACERRTRVVLLMEAANVHEDVLAAPEAAFGLWVQAFVEEPEVPGLEHRLRALSKRTARAPRLHEVYAAAAAGAAARPAVAARLYGLSARGLECAGAGSRRCLSAYEAAWDCLLELDRSGAPSSGHASVLRGLVRQAARAGAYPRAVRALLDLGQRSTRPDVGAFAFLEAQARQARALATLCALLSEALSEIDGQLPGEIAHYFDLQLARMFEGGCADLASAERVLCRAVARHPQASDLRVRMVALHRKQASPRLLDSLLALDDNNAAAAAADGRRDLDALFEAAGLVVELAEPARARRVLRRLYDEAAALCMQGREPVGTRGALVCLGRAVSLARVLAQGSAPPPAWPAHLPLSRPSGVRLLAGTAAPERAQRKKRWPSG